VRGDDGHYYSKTKRVHIPGTPKGPIYVNATGAASAQNGGDGTAGEAGNAGVVIKLEI
jgi:hypothetical protein